MFLDFFLLLKEEGLPVSIGEYLNLLEALNKRVTRFNVEEFYFLSKTILIKHEQFLDRYDLLFGNYFHGVELTDSEKKEIPKEWLQKEIDRLFQRKKSLIEKMGGLDKLMERLQQLLEEQKEKHQGGNKWIGTGGTSPFGNSGFNPEGINIGGKGGGRSAVKVWEKRQFQNYSSEGTEYAQYQTCLFKTRLRILTREGIEDELDLHTTIEKTSRNGGYLEIEMQPAKKNRVKVLLFFDVGGSMDPYVELCEQLFSAAKSELKHLEFFYFHNCVYESIWKDNNMRYSDRIPTFEILHKFNQDYRVIFVGDATMSPYELTAQGGSVEHYNDETGIAWLQRFVTKFPNTVWLNPSNEYYWDGTPTVKIIKEVFKDRMFPMTLDGLAKP
ncbi:MAG: VWA domain-containing protein [Saprospirales bacterium]|nr:VWA domain-containing protein [Saprospirales bacterium]